MGKKHNNLLEQVASIDNLRKAYKKTSKGKRYTVGYLIFKEHEEENLLKLQKELLNNTYDRGEYYNFKVRDPKERIISSLPFRDRIVQQAIHLIIEPIFDKTFYNHSYSCRKFKGVHKGVDTIQKMMNKIKQSHGVVFYLKIDFKKYFYSIDNKILFKELHKKIKDVRLLKIINKFDKFKGKGISVGNLLSQLFSNVYGNILDRFIKTKLKIGPYYRYADDSVILSHDKKFLIETLHKIRRFVSLYMKLDFSKWYIDNIKTKPLNFLGYRLSFNYKLLRKRSVQSMKRKIKSYLKHNRIDKLNRSILSWRGHVKHANSKNLLHYLDKLYLNNYYQNELSTNYR